MEPATQGARAWALEPLWNNNAHRAGHGFDVAPCCDGQPKSTGEGRGPAGKQVQDLRGR